VAFRLPTFNLLCRIWRDHAPPFPPAAAFIPSPCQLRPIKAALQQSSLGSATTLLLVPALTDIRGPQIGSNADIVEAPTGSGRFYRPLVVEDVAKGFPNEYRAATLAQAQWPFPTP
jgi:hypothetical protein